MHQFDEKAKQERKDAPASEVRRRVLKASSTLPMVLTLGSGPVNANTSIVCTDKPGGNLGEPETEFPLFLDSDILQELPSERVPPTTGELYYRFENENGVAYYLGSGDLVVQNGVATTPSCDNSFIV